MSKITVTKKTPTSVKSAPPKRTVTVTKKKPQKLVQSTDPVVPAIQPDQDNYDGKYCLCLKNRDDIVKLANNQSAYVMAYMVPRSVCEVASPDNIFVQMVATVSFTGYNHEGALITLAYDRPKHRGDTRMRGTSSIQFGGHVDNPGDIVSGGVFPAEYTQYIMSKDELNSTIFNTARREVMEELGIDITEKFGVTKETVELSVVTDDEPGESENLHIVFNITIDVPDIVEFCQSLTAEGNLVNKDEVENIRPLGLMLNDIYKGDKSANLNKLFTELTTNNNFDRLSAKQLIGRIILMFTFAETHVGFLDIFKAAVQAVRQKMADQQTQQTQQ